MKDPRIPTLLTSNLAEKVEAAGDAARVQPILEAAPEGPKVETLDDIRREVRRWGLKRVLEEVEAIVLSEVLDQLGNNKLRTAALLKITRAGLQYKVKKYRLGNAGEEI